MTFGLYTELCRININRSRESTFCCPGWTQRGLSGLCLIAVCGNNNCGPRGRCIKPNICLCEGGRVGPKCTDNDRGSVTVSAGSEASSVTTLCPSTCLNGGTCSDEGTCACRPGFAGEYCQEPVCKRECENGGRCIGPNRCACVYGYTGRYCEIDYRTGPCYRRLIDNDLCVGQLEV